ncbi:MAG: arginine deiminase [Lewinellaceae bacterium]|nr:arginine deiminase [Saprospiraceae bacterium]MCB9336632.1 arginine deiminase [Lewinellaceae bacterium]
MPIQVSSEIGPLRKVIVHRPDEGIARISPKRASELLFDDIVHLPQMQEEHDVFTGILRAFLGDENVLETKDLLAGAIGADQATKEWIIHEIVDYEELPKDTEKMLLDLADEELANVLITGYHKEKDYILFDPIPNFIFTRDIAVTVNDHVIITKPGKEARFRENYLSRFIFWSHPIFSHLKGEGRLINMNHYEEFPPSRRGEVISLEGGDMMVLNKNYLLIGRSERTSAHGIHTLRDKLFERGVVKNVVQINIPQERSYMHIDTVFTQINNNHIVAFKPIVLDGLSSNVEVHKINGTSVFYHSVRDFIINEVNPNMEFILSGDGESPYQEREQWTDGCNLVALKPGVAFTYDRNPHTEIAFRKAGYKTIHARKLLKDLRAGKVKPEDIENTIINLPSNELSRARGGSHCMTCPIERD